MKGFIKRMAMNRGLLLRKLPAGRQGDAFSDQRALLNGRLVRTVIDAGAYVGETARLYRRLFPAAAIHCFEPAPESFHRLSETFGPDGMVHLNQLALGDGKGSVELHVNRSAATSSILRPDPSAATYLTGDLFEEVTQHRADSTNIDSYCVECRIDAIDVLKLDIQGTELAALRGATRMLSRQAISLIYTELLIAPMYEGQGSIADILAVCESHHYRLYGLYNFAYGADTRLYQVDAILLSDTFTQGTRLQAT